MVESVVGWLRVTVFITSDQAESLFLAWLIAVAPFSLLLDRWFYFNGLSCSIVDLISMCEKCLCCPYAFLAVSLYTSHSMKRPFWLWKKVRYAVLKYLCRSRKPLRKCSIIPRGCFDWLKSLRTSAVYFPWTRAILCRHMHEHERHILPIIRKVRNGEWYHNFQSRDEWIGSRWTLLVYKLICFRQVYPMSIYFSFEPYHHPRLLTYVAHDELWSWTWVVDWFFIKSQISSFVTGFSITSITALAVCSEFGYRLSWRNR